MTGKVRQVDERDDTPAGTAPAGPGGPEVDSGATQPVTDQVRIAAVEAAVAAGLSDAAEPEATSGAPAGGRVATGGRPASDAAVDLAPAVAGEPPAGAMASIPELLDWVDPPTGQVPRVLLDDAPDPAGNGAGGTGRGPTWRERPADWDDDLGLGPFDEAVDETTRVAGRREGHVLEGPIDFADLDAELRRVVEPVVGDESDMAPVQGDEPGGEDEAWAAFAAAGNADRGAAAARPGARAVPDERQAMAEALDGGTSPRRMRQRAARPKRPGGPRPAGAPAPTSRGERVPAPADGEPGRRGARHSEGTPGRRNPLVATATGVVAGGIAIVCFLGGAVSALTLVTLVATLAAGEAFGTLRSSGRRPATLVGLVAVAALIVGSYLHGPIAVPVVLACCVVVAAIWYLAQAADDSSRPEASRAPAADLGATLLVVAWVGVLGSFAGLLLSPARFPDRHGVAFLVAAILLTVAHDVGSYAAGATLGKHRVLPSVSPNKTWEGLLGGTALTFLVAGVVLTHLHPLDLGATIGLAALVSVLGPLGDLTESLVKRDLGVKDMGRILPAHGGFFDRIDAMLFVLPAAYFLFRVAHLS